MEHNNVLCGREKELEVNQSEIKWNYQQSIDYTIETKEQM